MLKHRLNKQLKELLEEYDVPLDEEEYVLFEELFKKVVKSLEEASSIQEEPSEC